ncbi:MAG: plasmid stabilization protein [Chloroflexota bacterium]|nr:plasmid stabilization protein [Chloroflexota bacterium]
MRSNAPYTLVPSLSFQKQAKKFLTKHPELRGKYEAILATLRADPHDRSLRTHPLHGALQGRFGVTITENYRVIITIIVKEHAVHLLAIGDHDEAYR